MSTDKHPVLEAIFFKVIELPPGNSHKYEFHYFINGDEDFKEKLILQKSKFIYFDKDNNLVWIKNYYYGKRSMIYLSYNGIFIFDSDELDILHNLGSGSEILHKTLWEQKAKKDNDPIWLTRISANFKNP